MPASATGEYVQTSVVDANGNFRNIRAATMNISGTIGGFEPSTQEMPPENLTINRFFDLLDIPIKKWDAINFKLHFTSSI